MLDFLDKIRTMPAQTRRRVAGLCSLIVTVVIFVVWLGFGPLGPARKEEVLVKEETPSPLSAVFETFSSMWKKMVGQVSEIGQQFDDLESQLVELASTTVATSSPSSLEADLPKKQDTTGGIIIRDSFSTTSLKATSTSR